MCIYIYIVYNHVSLYIVIIQYHEYVRKRTNIYYYLLLYMFVYVYILHDL